MSTPSLNLQSFRNDPTLIEAQTRLQSTKAFRQMMEVLQQELPAKTSLPFGSNGTDFACAHGMEVGYLRAIETIKMLAEPVGAGDPVADFGADTIDD